jgi:long-chain-fatty-acid--CoA ligase ACSBG
MLSHDNIYYETLTGMKVSRMHRKEEVLVSYLPLSHIVGQLQDVWVSLFSINTVVFADSMALKGTLVETLKEVRPTVFGGVPRVWEKIKEGIQDIGRETTGLKKMVADACKKAGVDYHINSKDTLMYSVGKKTVYPKVAEALGLDRATIFFSGAAPLGEETLKFFLGLNIVIYELYGMSETTGMHTGMFHSKPRLCSVGPSVPGTELKLINLDSNGTGEVCMRGRNTMMGYLNREDKTTEDVDDAGWIHSGDMGVIDSDGYLYVNGIQLYAL